MVNVYTAHSQNSFYHFRIVVTFATFGLLTVTGFMVSSNIPTTDWIRDQTVIVVKYDNTLSRLHTFYRYVGIVCQSITESITRSAYMLYSRLCQATFWGFCLCLWWLTLTKLANVIFAHWHVILIVCKMTHELLARNTQKPMDNTWVWCTQVSSWGWAIL